MTPEEIAAAAAAAEKAQSEKAAAEKAAADAASQTDADKAGKTDAEKNAENAAQRLLKKAQDRVAELEAADAERKKAEMTETDRLKAEAAEAKTAANEAKLEALRLKAGKDLPEEALEFLTGTDAETLAAQAEKLKALYKPGAASQAGTQTRPAGGQQPTAAELSDAALKNKNPFESIRLKRAEAFGES